MARQIPKKFLDADGLTYVLSSVINTIDEVKADKTDIDNTIGDLSNLNTTAKNNLVAAINEAATNNPVTSVNGQTGDVTISAATDAQVQSAVSTWLSTNVDPETGYVIDNSLTITNAAADAKVTGDAIGEVKSTLDEIATSETIVSDNIWDISKNTAGYQLNTSGQPVENANYTITDYIEIVPSSTYWTGIIYNGNVYAPVAQRICFYDAQKAYVSKTGPTTAGVGTFDAPANIKYMRMAVYTVNFFGSGNTTAMIIKGNDAPAEYIPYFEPYITTELNADILPYDAIKNALMVESSPFYGKKVSWFGDSILKNTWWNNISTLFNMISTNNGVGGTKISGTAPASLCQTTRINGQYEDVVDPNTGETTVGGVAIPNDADFIIIGAGTNDWAQSVAMGNREIQYDANWSVVEDVTTFYQACHVMFRRLSELRPNARIIVLGTPFGFYVNRDAFTNKYGILNNQGKSALDYGDALCDVAEMWGHTAFRYGHNMGINSSNAATLLDPSFSGHLHPTTDEAKERFRRALLNALMSIKY